MICETVGLNPEKLIWLENYPPHPNDKSEIFTAEFSLVSFTYNPRTGTFSQPS